MSIKNALLTDSQIKTHLELQNTKYTEYISNLLLLLYEYNIDFTVLQLAKILAVSLVRNDSSLAKFLLKDKRYELPVILKTCEILDSKRLLKQLSLKTEKIKNKKKLTKHKSLLANLKALNEDLECLSLTKAKIKFFKKNWIRTLTKENLEFMALLYPIKNWKKIIDLFHLKPTDFQLSWFTNYIFTKEAPEGSIVKVWSNTNQDNIKEVIKTYKLPYDFLRLKINLDDEAMSIVLSYTGLADIIRHWSSFETEENIQIVANRIKNGEAINMPYGELLKRIQMFIENKKQDNPVVTELISLAEGKLGKYKVAIEEPVVVLGDASPSMEIAIKTSSIITSILVKLCNAKMHLFTDKDEPIQNPPSNVREVLDAMNKFKVSGSTAPAASLYPYYQRKEVVKTFILVTDEEENCSYSGSYSHGKKEGMFADIYKKYREEVYPAKLVFVSFLNNNKDGQMVKELKKEIPNVDKDIVQFIMNSNNPDLRKLDELLNTLSLDTIYYDEKCGKLMKAIDNTNSNIFFDTNYINDVLNDKFELEEPDSIIICI